MQCGMNEANCNDRTADATMQMLQDVEQSKNIARLKDLYTSLSVIEGVRSIQSSRSLNSTSRRGVETSFKASNQPCPDIHVLIS